MSDSESSDDGLSENEELGHDEEMEDDGSEWEDASSDEDDDEPPARRVRQELTERYDTADTYRPAVPFNPRRPTGPQLADRTRQDAMLRFSKEVDFFKLFFSSSISSKTLWFHKCLCPGTLWWQSNLSKQSQRLGFDICQWNVWFYCLLYLYGLHSVTLARVLLVLCIIVQWQLGLSYDFLQGQI